MALVSPQVYETSGVLIVPGASAIATALRRAHAAKLEASGTLLHSLSTLEIVANSLTEAGEAVLRQLIDDEAHCGVDVVYQKRAGAEGK